jgi:hypothetical protein
MEIVATMQAVAQRASSTPNEAPGSDLFAFSAYDDARVTGLAAEFAAAQPFSHIVVDNFLTAPQSTVTAAFPVPEWTGWTGFKDAYQPNKRVCGDIDVMPPLFQDMVHELCGPAFLGFLEKVTGIRGLIPDPYLQGGGLHASGTGGTLTPHADFHHYGRMALYRRINVLVYFNPDWQPEYGGSLELFEKGKDRPDQSVVPVYGRMVAFLTDYRSIHGFTQPVVGPDRWRRSLALYYYTAEKADQFSGDGDTHWQQHGKQHGTADQMRLIAYKGLMRIANIFSRLAHRANPNFRKPAGSKP